MFSFTIGHIDHIQGLLESEAEVLVEEQVRIIISLIFSIQTFSSSLD